MWICFPYQIQSEIFKKSLFSRERLLIDIGNWHAEFKNVELYRVFQLKKWSGQMTWFPKHFPKRNWKLFNVWSKFTVTMEHPYTKKLRFHKNHDKVLSQNENLPWTCKSKNCIILNSLNDLPLMKKYKSTLQPYSILCYMVGTKVILGSIRNSMLRRGGPSCCFVKYKIRKSKSWSWFWTQGPRSR